MKVAGGGAQLRRLELACTAVSEVAGASWVAAVSRLTGLGLRHTQVTLEQVSLLCTALALPSSQLSTLGRDTNQALISDKYFHISKNIHLCTIFDL